MEKLNQTEFKDMGNCFQTCLAMMLDVEIEDVPHFPLKYADRTWWKECRKWFCGIGIRIICYDRPLYCITNIISYERDCGCYHAVIVRENKIFHNPLETDHTLLKEMEKREAVYYILFFEEPGKYARWWLDKKNKRNNPDIMVNIFEKKLKKEEVSLKEESGWNLRKKKR